MEQLKSNYNTTLWVLFEILNFLPGTNAHDNVAVTMKGVPGESTPASTQRSQHAPLTPL